MLIPEGTPLGVIIDGKEALATAISMGDVVELGPLKGIPLWTAKKGSQVLFFLPSPKLSAVVMKAGRRQTAAFLLGPNEELLLRDGQEQRGTVYRFFELPLVDAVAEAGDRCSFCRAEVVDHGVTCSGMVFGTLSVANCCAVPVRPCGETMRFRRLLNGQLKLSLGANSGAVLTKCTSKKKPR